MLTLKQIGNIDQTRIDMDVVYEHEPTTKKAIFEIYSSLHPDIQIVLIQAIQIAFLQGLKTGLIAVPELMKEVRNEQP